MKVEKSSGSFILKVHATKVNCPDVIQVMQTRVARRLCARSVALMMPPFQSALLMARSQQDESQLISSYMCK
jgi:hypothetical protein